MVPHLPLPGVNELTIPYLYTYESAGVVGGRQQIFYDGTHHPEHIFLLHE